MDSRHIDLTQSTIAEIASDASSLRIRIDPAIIIESMTGSVERTKWKQRIDLILSAVTQQPTLVDTPTACLGGDVDDNIYTYRDMIPLPLSSRGHVALRLKVEGAPELLEAEGEALELKAHDSPSYIEHLRSPTSR